MTKDHLAEAVELFKSGYSCSQSVLAVFSGESGLPRETANKIASPFGGGIGGYGKTCGALTGAIMVIGLKYGPSDIADTEAKSLARRKTRELLEKFEATHGTCQCSNLVGFDMSKLSEPEIKARQTHFHTLCPKFLETVVVWLEEEL